MKKTLWLTCLLVSIQSFALAQCIPANSENLENAKFKALFHNDGGRFWDYQGRPGFQIPKANPSVDGKHSGGACNLWIGGMDENGILHVAAPTYRQAGTDYFAGPYSTNGNYGCNQPPQVAFSYATLGPQHFLPLANGKIMALHYNGFSVWDPNSTAAPINYTTGPGRTYLQAAQLPNGKVLVVGVDNTPSTAPQPLYLVDTTTWTMIQGPTPNYYSRGASVTRLPSGKVLLNGFGGSEIFDPITNLTLPVAPMDTPRSHATTALLPNGTVMAFGGNRSGYTYGASPDNRRIELFDPVTETWSDGPNVQYSRLGASATVLPNGLVLIAGGSATTKVLEYYDPVSQQVSVAGYLPHPLDDHQAVLDDEGEFYFFGNLGGSAGEGHQILKFNPVTGKVSELQEWMNEPSATFVKPGLIIAKGQGSFQNGHMLLDCHTDRFEEQRYQRIWKVSADQIGAFRTAQSNGTLVPEDFLDIVEWPAKGNIALGESNYLAPFVDVNQDGDYQPVSDGDYPCINGDEMLFWIMNDIAGPHQESNGLPFGFEIRGSAWRYNCATTPNCPDTLLDYAIFHRYQIVNFTSNIYRQVFISNWADLDLGDYSDDYVGTDSTLNLSFIYNSSNNDQGNVGYGTPPPAVGIQYLGNPLAPELEFSMTYNADPVSPYGYPQSPADYYQYMQGMWRDSSRLVNNGLNGYAGTLAGPETNYVFSGDAGFCGTPSNGWTEVSAGINAPNRLFVQSIGPLDIQPGSVFDFDFVTLWAKGSNNLNSVCRLKQLADSVQGWWSGVDRYACSAGVGIQKPQATNQSPLWVYPNPSAGIFRLEWPWQTQSCHLRVFNSFGQMVREQFLPFGESSAELDLGTMPTGTYWLQLNAGDQTFMGKAVMVK